MQRGRTVLAASVLTLVGGSASNIAATITPGLASVDFDSPTVEDFQGTQGLVNSFDFGNGMTYANLSAGNDLVNLAGTYGLGSEGNVTTGRGGVGDRYFGAGSSPTTFEFAFTPGVTQFGFYGAEAVSSAPSNGQLELELYDLSDNLIGTASVTTAGTFAWDQFHGFESDVPIGSVVFRNAGFMVADDVHFGPVPEPAGVGIVTAGAVAVICRSKRRRRLTHP